MKWSTRKQTAYRDQIFQFDRLVNQGEGRGREGGGRDEKPKQEDFHQVNINWRAQYEKTEVKRNV